MRLRAFGLLPGIALALAGCSAGGAQVEWSMPVGGMYGVHVADLGDVIIVPRGQAIEGYDTAGKQLWSVTLADEAQSCVAAGSGAMCVAGTQIFVDRDGQTVARSDLAFVGQAGDRAYYARGEEDGVVLIEEEADTPLDQLGASAQVLARYEGRTAYLPDGTKVERAGTTYPEPLQRLLDEGVLTVDSPWLNPAGIASVAQPLADGFVVVEAGQAGARTEPSTLTLFDLAGNETARFQVTPVLYMNVSPSWTRATLEKIAQDAQALKESRAFVFDDARVVGFEQVLTDSVAPGYANVEALRAEGKTLSFDAIQPETLRLAALDYPYVSVAGTGSQTVVATFDLSTAKRVVEASCWLSEATYCATPTALEKVNLSGQS